MRVLLLITLAATLTCGLFAEQRSEEFLSDSELKALGESRLDDTKPASPVVRIIVHPSFEAPIMIKWLIQEPGAQSEAIVRRPQMEVSDDGSVTYRGFSIDSRVTLSKGQTFGLYWAKEHAKLRQAQSKDWKPPALDGTTWIVEYSDSESYRLLVRSNLRTDPAFLGVEFISKERLLTESNLTHLCMLLWNLTGVNDLLYFQDKNAQQDGADQPATAPESKPEGQFNTDPEPVLPPR